MGNYHRKYERSFWRQREHSLSSYSDLALDELEEALAGDAGWVQLTNPNNLDIITYSVRTGWLFRVANGEASRRFVAESILNDEVLYDENVPHEDDETSEERSMLDMVDHDLQQLDKEDFTAMAEILEALGLVTNRVRNRYLRGLTARD